MDSAAAPDVSVHTKRWAEAARELVTWSTPWSTLWTPDGRFGRWFDGAELGVAENCVQRHLTTRATQPALLWEGEPGDRRVVSYGELDYELRCLEQALRGMGVRRGDRVALHLGWIPETVVAMLACARIGALHSVIPTPLHSDALTERLLEFSPKVLFTQDGAWRRGAILPLKARADEALSAIGDVEHTVVVRRTGNDISWYEGDSWYHDLISSFQAEGTATPAEPLPAGQPLLSTHLANRNGKPLSVVLSAANVLVSSAALHRYGVSDGGVFWLPGDASWIATQVHGVYGPLCNGDTTVMFEGALDTPNHRRAWEIVDRYRISTVALSPSLARTLREWSLDLDDTGRRLATLRRCVTLGEQSSPGLVEWMATEWGADRVSVADAWGQIELGGIVQIDKPVHPDQLPRPGLQIVDEDGKEVPDGDSGELVMTSPWPGAAAAVVGDAAEDVLQDHFGRYPGLYATGDKARRVGGEIEYFGRKDPVVSVSGHLVSLTEVREALLEHPYVQAADVMEFHLPERGRTLLAAVVLDREVREQTDLDAVSAEILDAVRDTLGGLARPRLLLVLDRFGDELAGPERRAAMTALAGVLRPLVSTAAELSWTQVLAAAGHQPD